MCRHTRPAPVNPRTDHTAATVALTTAVGWLHGQLRTDGGWSPSPPWITDPGGEHLQGVGRAGVLRHGKTLIFEVTMSVDVNGVRIERAFANLAIRVVKERPANGPTYDRLGDERRWVANRPFDETRAAPEARGNRWPW